MRILNLQRNVHELAVRKGWWDRVPDLHSTVAIKLAMMLTEVGEALRCVSNDEMHTKTREDGKPEGLPAELADIVIRVADLAQWLGIDLESEIMAKHEYNESRPWRHGGKKL